MKRGNLWIHLPFGHSRFRLWRAVRGRRRNFCVCHRLQLNAALILNWSNSNRVRRWARIKNVICPGDCGLMWVRTFSKNYVIFSCQLHFDGLQQRARRRNKFVFFFIFLSRTEHETEKEKWKMMNFVFEMLVVCRFVVVICTSLSQSECLVLVSTYLYARLASWIFQILPQDFRFQLHRHISNRILNFSFLFVSMRTACERIIITISPEV